MMEAKVGKLITYHNMYHVSVHVERLHVKRENSGGVLIQQELTYKITTKGLKKYLNTTTD